MLWAQSGVLLPVRCCELAAQCWKIRRRFVFSTSTCSLVAALTSRSNSFVLSLLQVLMGVSNMSLVEVSNLCRAESALSD
jgi:hypothetical protein